MINFDTWLELVEKHYGAKIVDWMLPFAQELFDSFTEPKEAAIELASVWEDHNND